MKITPALDASIGVAGNTLTINGATKRDTRYVVHLPATLRDEFGQTLGKAEAWPFDVGEATPALMAFPQSLTTTDPSAEALGVGHVGRATRRSRSTSTPRIRRGGSTTRTSSNVGGTTTNCSSTWHEALDDDDHGRRRRAGPHRVDHRLERRSPRRHRPSPRGRLADPAVRPRTPTSTGRTGRRSRGCRSRRSVSTRCRPTTS